MDKGKYIVFEGVSGTGKETQAKLLSEVLKKSYGISSVVVYHPSPELKDVLQTWRETRAIDETSEVYFLLADRFNRVTNDILPALSQGQWVISLRSSVSALVYQGKTKELRKWIQKEFDHFEPVPDALFHFRISASDALARIRKRHELTGERFGKFETLTLLEEKNQKYDDVLSAIAHISVDGNQPIDAIHENILSSLQKILPEKK